MPYDTFPTWAEFEQAIKEFLLSGEEEQLVAVTSDVELLVSDVGEGLTFQIIVALGCFPHPWESLASYSAWVRDVRSSALEHLRDYHTASGFLSAWFQIDPQAKTFRLRDGYVSPDLKHSNEEWNIYAKGFWRLLWDEIEWLESLWGLTYEDKAAIEAFLKQARRPFLRSVKRHLEGNAAPGR